MEIKCLSFNFKNAEVKIKERFALHKEEIQRIATALKEIIEVDELMILSTCNRTEFYFSSEKYSVIDLKRCVVLVMGVQATPSGVMVTEINDESETVRHLFEVAIGMHSQVCGDIQVIHQVKEAYLFASESNTIGVLFHHLLHQVFHLNKRIVNETEFKAGASSIASAAVQLVDELTVKNKKAPILLIGAGKNGEDTLKNLLTMGYQNITICNRTKAKADLLVEKYGVFLIDFDVLPQKIQNYKVVLTSIHTRNTLINSAFLDLNQVGLDYTYFLDLSVPAAVDVAIESNPSFLVYSIDYMEERNEQTQKARLTQLDSVHAIVDEEVNFFDHWKAVKTMTNAFEKYKEQLIQLRKEDLQQFVFDAAQKEGVKVDDFNDETTSQIINQSIVSWQFVCKKDVVGYEQFKTLFSEVFDIEAQGVKSSR